MRVEKKDGLDSLACPKIPEVDEDATDKARCFTSVTNVSDSKNRRRSGSVCSKGCLSICDRQR